MNNFGCCLIKPYWHALVGRRIAVSLNSLESVSILPYSSTPNEADETLIAGPIDAADLNTPRRFHTLTYTLECIHTSTCTVYIQYVHVHVYLLSLSRVSVRLTHVLHLWTKTGIIVHLSPCWCCQEHLLNPIWSLLVYTRDWVHGWSASVPASITSDSESPIQTRFTQHSPSTFWCENKFDRSSRYAREGHVSIQ
jgi:hypothetical protein